MKVSYDAEDDILYMHFKDGPADSVREVEDGVVIEPDAKGEVMGIELSGLKKKKEVVRRLTQIGQYIRKVESNNYRQTAPTFTGTVVSGIQSN